MRTRNAVSQRTVVRTGLTLVAILTALLMASVLQKSWNLSVDMLLHPSYCGAC